MGEFPCLTPIARISQDLIGHCHRMGAGHRIIDISADLIDVIRQIVCRSVKPFPPRIGGHAIQQMPMLQ